MALDYCAAQDFTFTINGVTIGGVKQFALDTDIKDADSTTFEAAGNETHMRVGISKTLKLEGKYLEDPGNGSQDAGQALVETKANAVGSSAVVLLAVTTPGGAVRSWYGTVKMDTLGGGNDDVTNWGCTFKRSGADVS